MPRTPPAASCQRLTATTPLADLLRPALAHVNLTREAEVGVRDPGKARAAVVVASLQVPLQHVRPEWQKIPRGIGRNRCF